MRTAAAPHLMPLSRLYCCALIVAAALGGVTRAAAQTADVVLTNGLVQPHSLTVTADGTIYITDGGGLGIFGGGSSSDAHRVMRYVPTTGALSVLAGSLIGERGTTKNTLANAGYNARFFSPAGIVQSRGGLVVADSGNHTIRYVGFDGIVTNIAGSGDPTISGLVNGLGEAARFNTPLGLAVDAAGNLYVADSKNNVIRKVDPANAVTTYATNFNQPNGVAVGDNGDVWVADTLNHQIKVVRTNAPAPDGIFTNVLVRAGTGIVGSSDSFPVAATSQLSSPRGVAWINSSSGLLITDSGNNTIRRLYTNSTLGLFTLTTSLGSAGQQGLVNGATNTARFNSPIGVASDVLSGAYVVADSGNAAIRRIQQGVVLPPVSTPDIGTVVLSVDPDTGQTATRLTPIVDSIFFNDVVIAVRPESGVTTLYNYVATSSDPFNTEFPVLSVSPPAYRDGLPALPTTLITPVLPDFTVKAQSSQVGRVSSGIQTARFRFKTSTPSISGNNAASFVLNNSTTNAQMYYTIDGVTEPTNSANGTTIFGPIAAGTTLSFNLNGSNLLFRVKAFRSNYEPSFTISNLFSPTNFSANRISFGFESGEASSKFIASAGSIFYAPVTLSLLPGQNMYSLQFGLAVTNGSGNTNSVAAGAVNFFSTLLRQLPDNTFVNLPASYLNTQTNLVITNSTSSTNLLLVGWLARANSTNFFDTTIQDLIRFSQPHDRRFNSQSDSKVVLGGYGFRVPGTATNGQTYSIRISRPSGTADGVSQDVFIDAPVTGTLTALKTVTVGSPAYLVGDVAPFGWFNAGDFGDTNLLNNDVLQTFQTAILGVHAPLAGSDLFDAMDSCCGLGTNNGSGVFTNLGTFFSTGLTNGIDTNINRIHFGDGTLNASDLYVTFRRSLDPSLTNFVRFRSNGVLYAATTSNSFRGVVGASYNGALASSSSTPAREAQSLVNPADVPSVTFAAGEVVAGAGQTLNIPITARVTGPALRVLALRMRVVPLDGSPALTTAVQFQPGATLGPPTFSGSQDVSIYGAAWLNDAVAGLSGDATVGTLIVTLPAGAGADAAYAVRFEHASASPAGIASVAARMEPGLISTRVRNLSSWNDVITDAWRLRHFGTLSNLLSAASADADGDGIPNWAEFRAGTDPNDAGSALALRVPGLLAGGARLRWPTAPGKTYIIETAPFIGSTNWTAIATNVPGSGRDVEFQTPPPNGPQFFRVRLLEP